MEKEKFDEDEKNLHIDELKKLSDIYETLSTRFKYLSYDTVEYLCKPVRDLLIANGVNVDDDSDL